MFNYRVFATPFRLFFFAAGLLACALVTGWYLIVAGHIRVEPSMGAVNWHAHEMVFGYFGAVLVGFLLTAAASWTKLPTVGLPGTLALLSLWLSSRLAHSLGVALPGSTYLEVALFAAAALAIGRPIVRSRRLQNLVFPILLVAMGVGDLLMHLGIAGDIAATWGLRGLWLGIDSVAVAILVFGGRIVPLFTKNALGLSAVRQKGLLDALGLAALVALMLVHLAGMSARMEAAAFLFAGALTLARLHGWGGRASLRHPLLAVLHVGWAMVGLGMIAVGLALLRPQAALTTAAHHLLYIGGFGVLSLGMMARVALGHTGRPRVASLGTSLAFLCLGVAAILRGIAGIAHGRGQLHFLLGATALWVLAFALFLWIYAPVLLTPRVDGNPG